jgi:tetraprenyl-beta-curcumene synthase
VKAAKEIAAAVSALFAYRTTVLPLVAPQLRHWRRQAEAIPDPRTRELALAALAEKAGNVEAVAVFATLAPRAGRRAALEAIIPLQVAVDYLDSLEEAPTLASPNCIKFSLWREENLMQFAGSADGGYLERLQDAWRQAVAALPSAQTCRDLIERAVERSNEGQARTHAAEHGDVDGLRRWAGDLPSPRGYRWWELAAGASSSVAAHALIALAATPGAHPRQAELVDIAYNPSIGALTVLLDNLVDRDEDAAAGAHNYMDYYADPDDAACRIAAIADDARAAIAPLPRRSRHEAILAGVAAFYAAQPGARRSFARPIVSALRRTLGPPVGLLAAAIGPRQHS